MLAKGVLGSQWLLLFTNALEIIYKKIDAHGNPIVIYIRFFTKFEEE